MRSLKQIALQALVQNDCWKFQVRSLQMLPEDIANRVVHALLSAQRLTPGQLLLFRDTVSQLQLCNLHNVGAQEWLPVVGELGHLTALDLSFSKGLKATSVSQMCSGNLWLLQSIAPSLRTLSLAGCYGVHAEALAHLLTRMPRLQNLNLADMSMRGSITRALAACTSLQAISLAAAQLTSADLSSLMACTQLHTLELYMTSIDDAALPYLAQLRLLRHLNIAHTYVTYMPCFPQLTRLVMAGGTIQGCWGPEGPLDVSQGPSADGLVSVALSLQHLSIQQCSFDSGNHSSVAALPLHFVLRAAQTCLKQLLLDGLKLQAASTVPNSLPVLYTTDVHDTCKKSMFPASLPQLQQLVLVGPHADHIMPTQLSCFSSLSSLTLSGPSISAACWTDLLQLHNLTYLNLNQQRWLTGKAVHHSNTLQPAQQQLTGAAPGPGSLLEHGWSFLRPGVWPGLRRLDLSSSTWGPGAQLPASVHLSVTQLWLDRVVPTAAVCAQLVELMPRLRELSLAAMPQKDALSYMRALVFLTSLRIRNDPFLYTEDIAATLTSLPALQQLHISGPVPLTQQLAASSAATSSALDMDTATGSLVSDSRVHGKRAAAHGLSKHGVTASRGAGNSLPADWQVREQVKEQGPGWHDGVPLPFQLVCTRHHQSVKGSAGSRSMHWPATESSAHLSRRPVDQRYTYSRQQLLALRSTADCSRGVSVPYMLQA